MSFGGIFLGCIVERGFVCDFGHKQIHPYLEFVCSDFLVDSVVINVIHPIALFVTIDVADALAFSD